MTDTGSTNTVYLAVPLEDYTPTVTEAADPYTSKMGGLPTWLRLNTRNNDNVANSDSDAPAPLQIPACPHCNSPDHLRLLAQLLVPLTIYDRILYICMCTACSTTSLSRVFCFRSQLVNEDYFPPEVKKERQQRQRQLQQQQQAGTSPNVIAEGGVGGGGAQQQQQAATTSSSDSTTAGKGQLFSTAGGGDDEEGWGDDGSQEEEAIKKKEEDEKQETAKQQQQGEQQQQQEQQEPNDTVFDTADPASVKQCLSALRQPSLPVFILDSFPEELQQTTSTDANNNNRSNNKAQQQQQQQQQNKRGAAAGGGGGGNNKGKGGGNNTNKKNNGKQQEKTIKGGADDDDNDDDDDGDEQYSGGVASEAELAADDHAPEGSRDEAVLDEFLSRLDASGCRSQVVRWCPGGSPLRSSAKCPCPPPQVTPPCPNCGAPRVFECQLMPSMLYFFEHYAHRAGGGGNKKQHHQQQQGSSGSSTSSGKSSKNNQQQQQHSQLPPSRKEDPHFGTIAVYTCSRHCDNRETGLHLEYCFVEPEL